MSRFRNILLLVLLIVCAASFWWVRRGSVPSWNLTKAPPRPVAETPEAVPLRSVHLAVLNGTGEPGLARRFSRRLPEIGCVVVSMGDAPHDSFTESLLINRRLTESEAQRLAARLGVERLLVEWDSRCREDAVLVLGRDHDHLVFTPPPRP